jgi:hypothetical protein
LPSQLECDSFISQIHYVEAHVGQKITDQYHAWAGRQAKAEGVSGPVGLEKKRKEKKKGIH